MKDIFVKNLLNLIILIIFLIIFLEILNITLAGIPIYDKMNINRYQITQVKSKNKIINKDFFPRIEYLIPKKSYLVNCGYQESGVYHQVYNPDINGFWNDEIDLYKKTDIVMIGDSFGFSSCVNYPNDFKSQLENISKKKILNLSVGGSGPLKQLRIIEEFTKDTNFEYFVWFYYEGNDNGDLTSEVSKNLFKKKISFSKKLPMNFIDKETEGVKILKSRDEIFVDYDKLLKLIKTYPNPTEKDYTKEWDHEIIIKSKIFLAERLKGLSSLIKYFVKKNNVNNLNKIDYERVLNRMDKFLTKKNVKKRYIYYLPMYSRLSHKSQSHPDIKNLNNLRNSIKSIGEKYNFEFIDGSIPFMNVKNPLDIFPYQLPNHYNELGYKLLAEYANKKIF